MSPALLLFPGVAAGVGAAASIGKRERRTPFVIGESGVIGALALLASRLPSATSQLLVFALAAYAASRVLGRLPRARASGPEAHLLPWLVVLAAFARAPADLGSLRVVAEAFVASLLASSDRTPARWLASALALLPLLGSG